MDSSRKSHANDVKARVSYARPPARPPNYKEMARGNVMMAADTPVYPARAESAAV